MLKSTNNRQYLVPVLMHTLDILELLLRSDFPLKTKDISNTTGVSQTTMYKVLRTLADRGYLAQDHEGKFSLLNQSELKNTLLLEMMVGGARPLQSVETNLPGEHAI